MKKRRREGFSKIANPQFLRFFIDGSEQNSKSCILQSDEPVAFDDDSTWEAKPKSEMQNTKPNKNWTAETKQVPKHRRSENATFVREPKVKYNKLSLL